MRIFKTPHFARWANKEKLPDASLAAAVDEMERGLIDARLGGQVFKKRVAIRGRGKSGGLRTLLAFQHGERSFFVFGFAKNERANIKPDELKALKLLAGELLSYSDRKLNQSVDENALIEVETDD